MKITIEFNRNSNKFDVKHGSLVLGSYTNYVAAQYRAQMEIENG